MTDTERIAQLEKEVEALKIAVQGLLDKMKTGHSWQELSGND